MRTSPKSKPRYGCGGLNHSSRSAKAGSAGSMSSNSSSSATPTRQIPVHSCKSLLGVDCEGLPGWMIQFDAGQIVIHDHDHRRLILPWLRHESASIF